MGLLDYIFGVGPKAAPAPAPQPAPKQGGLLGSAQRDLGLQDEYRRHVLDAQEAGNTPLPYDQWLKQRQTPAPTPDKK